MLAGSNLNQYEDRAVTFLVSSVKAGSPLQEPTAGSQCSFVVFVVSHTATGSIYRGNEHSSRSWLIPSTYCKPEAVKMRVAQRLGGGLLHSSVFVLTAETKTRDATEPSGDPEILWNCFGKIKMGDRVQHSKPEGLQTVPCRLLAA